jgi:hypothetical protein
MQCKQDVHQHVYIRVCACTIYIYAYARVPYTYTRMRVYHIHIRVCACTIYAYTPHQYVRINKNMKPPAKKNIYTRTSAEGSALGSDRGAGR